MNKDDASMAAAAKKAFDQLRETEEGRKLSEELTGYLKNMNERFETIFF